MKTNKNEITLDEIENRLELLIDRLFFEIQEKHGINNGDADFSQVFELDEKTEELAGIMFEILKFQKRLDEEKTEE